MEKINLTDFQKRKFKRTYLAVYVVTKDIRIRKESCIADKTLYVIYGVNILGDREILMVQFDKENNNRFWLEQFEDLKARTLENIVFFVTPRHKNIERCVKIVYNNTKIVHSPDSITSIINKFFAQKTSRKMQISFKNLFLAKDKENYKIELEMFKETYLGNKLIKMLLDSQKEEIEAFYEYSYPLRKLLYPYYAIREMQKELNKLKTRDNLCSNINEIIEEFLPYINSFELGRSHSKEEWLELIDKIYEEYPQIMEEYVNG